MIVIERLVQHINPEKWAELESLDQQFNQAESQHGFPKKQRKLLISGGDELQTLIIERQWASLAAMEAAYESLLADPAYQALSSAGVIKDTRMELYQLLP
jgi:hypothetical protein